MKELMSKAGQQWLLWRLAIARCFLFSVVTLGTAIQTATISVDYTSMHPWEKKMLWLGVFVLWGNQMLTFLDRSAQRIAEGKPPVGGDGQTEFLKKMKENG